MRVRHVRLAAILFSLGLALAAAAAVAVALRAGPAPPSPGAPGAAPTPTTAAELDGRALYARYCERCHAADRFSEDLRAPDQGTVVLDMLDFLDDHGNADCLQDRALLRFMLEQAR
jgi:mono/diheme cytochrome c family protein